MLAFSLVQNRHLFLHCLAEPAAFYITTSVANKLLMKYLSSLVCHLETTSLWWPSPNSRPDHLTQQPLQRCLWYPARHKQLLPWYDHAWCWQGCAGRWVSCGREFQCSVCERLGGSQIAKTYSTLPTWAWGSSSHPGKTWLQSQRSHLKLLSFSVPRYKCL